MSCANRPRLVWVPPEYRWTDSVAAWVPHARPAGQPPGNGAMTVGTDGTYAASWLSPSTHRMSNPALNAFFVPIAFAHCVMPPTPLVGTFWSVASRTMLRVVAALVT